MDFTNTKMQYVRFGNTGLRVSRIAGGCMSYGSDQWSPWVKNEKESMEMIKAMYDAGINFFDTADSYSNGESERILGKAIREFQLPRQRIVVATKVYFVTHQDVSVRLLGQRPVDDPALVNAFGLSRKHIFAAVHGSLQRLGLDYIDLYQIHRFDPDTPIEETMEALHNLVKMGKVHYIGASSMPAWQFQKANNIAEKHGWTKFTSMQNLYNLIQREEEREMIPYCADQGIAIIPWSPLARGVLTGKDRQTSRTESDKAIDAFFTGKENDDAIVDRVVTLAEKKKVKPAQVALAWVLSKPYITAPILGMGKKEYLDDALGALDVELTEDEIKYLEEIYVPHNVIPM
ncbi:NADP-dependent oxidoreductase domain-containing protein [Syncephalastrum racemosum]|uniref:NADP-dependent oxidoreductase domain-containing protein n=1 Tax=Syncephalastrum racemosum TaxID=13706 RepID=A0A1X2HKJ4_SYNRA|nr:NADP-dependent oxidoreductase domain-containing protein [Syncephalastrum racemosum]